MRKQKFGLLLAFLLAIISTTGCGGAEVYKMESLSLITESTQESVASSDLEDHSWDNSSGKNEQQESGKTSQDVLWPDASQSTEETENAASESVKDTGETQWTENGSETEPIAKDGEYTGKEDVALYLYTYGELPSNFITKKEASELGWEGGSLEPYAPGKSIGGDYFGNYEGKLPKKKGREYHECDIDTKGAKKRGSKRIVYSNDGLIYYTEDHYETYELLYGEE